MLRRKPIRSRGKLPLSKYFQDFESGESVAVTIERSLQPRFPSNLQGKTGIVEGKRGKAYLVKIRVSDKDKTFIIEPIHLKKIIQK